MAEYLSEEPGGEHDWDQNTNNDNCQEKQADIPCKALVPINQTGVMVPVSHHQVAINSTVQSGLVEVESPTNNYNVEQSGGYFQLGSNNTQNSITQNISIGTLILPNANASMDVLKPDEIIVGTEERIEKLPQDIKTFVGKSNVLDNIKTQFENHKFVVLHGGPCLGKTTVATKFTHQVKHEYGIIVWVDLKDLESEAKDGNKLQNICTKILSELNVDTNDLKGDMVVHLECKLRKIRMKMLLILDNIEDFIDIPERSEQQHPILPLANLLESFSKNAPNFVKVLGVSRYQANETSFRDCGSVPLEPLSQEEGRQYLSILLKEKHQGSIDLLNEKCCGIPLACEIVAKMLNEISDGDKDYFCRKIKEVPLMELSKVMNRMFDIFLGSLSADENRAVEILSIFPSSFSWEFAEKLCGELEKDSFLIERLNQKSVISKSNVDGYLIHPFLREFILCKEGFQDKLSSYRAALIKVYLGYFMKLSDESFDKDNSRKCINELYKRTIAFNHLVVLTTSLCHEKALSDEQRENVRSKVFNEDSNWSFILFLRFLYYLVPQKDIEAIFTFLLAIALEEDRGIIQACLDELKWVSDKDVSLITEDYEYVMAERRILSDMVKSIGREPQNGLEERLMKLSDKIQRLQNCKVRSYYLLKTEKLLGEMFKKSNNGERALVHYEKSLDISKEAFGDGFLTIDCYERVAVDLSALGDADKAKARFTEAYNMATRTGVQDLGKITNLLLSMGSFLIKRPDEDSREEGKTLLLKSVNINRAAGNSKGMCQAMQRLSMNDQRYSVMVQEYFRTVEEPDKAYIDLMNGMFYECRNVASQSVDKEEVTRETKKGIEILQKAIEIVAPRLEHRFKDEYVRALFCWNRDIAVRCAHVMLESERKPFAKEALRLAEKYTIKEFESDMNFLRLVDKSAKRSVEEEQHIMHVTFLENVTVSMINKKQGKKLQRELLKAKEQCKESWLHLKIIKCLLQIPAIQQNERLKYVEETIKLLSNQDVLTPQPFFVLRKHIPALLTEASEKQGSEPIKQLYEYCITVIKTLESKKMEDEKQGVWFQFEFYIILLENYPWCYKENEVRLHLTKKVLQIGKERNFFKKKYSGLDKKYKDFIDSKQVSFLRTLWENLTFVF